MILNGFLIVLSFSLYLFGTFFLIFVFIPETSDDHAQHAGDDDQNSCGNRQGENARKGCHQEDAQVEDKGGLVDDGLIPQAEDRLNDQDAHTDADAGEGVLNDGLIGKSLQECGYDQDDHDGDRDETDSRGDSSRDSLPAAADKGRDIQGDQAGGTLSYGKIVGQILCGGPPPVLDQIPLQKGKHGIAASEIDSADFKKCKIQFQ